MTMSSPITTAAPANAPTLICRTSTLFACRIHLAVLALLALLARDESARDGAAGNSSDRPARSWRDDRGQATTEYALVLLAAALVALLVVAWATAGGGAAKVARLFNAVIDSVIDKV